MDRTDDTTKPDFSTRDISLALRLMLDDIYRQRKEVLEAFIAKRYASYSEGIGKDIVGGRVGFSELEAYALIHVTAPNASGRQEYLETVLNQYILEG